MDHFSFHHSGCLVGQEFWNMLFPFHVHVLIVKKLFLTLFPVTFPLFQRKWGFDRKSYLLRMTFTHDPVIGCHHHIPLVILSVAHMGLDVPKTTHEYLFLMNYFFFSNQSLSRNQTYFLKTKTCCWTEWHKWIVCFKSYVFFSKKKTLRFLKRIFLKTFLWFLKKHNFMSSSLFVLNKKHDVEEIQDPVLYSCFWVVRRPTPPSLGLLQDL